MSVKSTLPFFFLFFEEMKTIQRGCFTLKETKLKFVVQNIKIYNNLRSVLKHWNS